MRTGWRPSRGAKGRSCRNGSSVSSPLTFCSSSVLGERHELTHLPTLVLQLIQSHPLPSPPPPSLSRSKSSDILPGFLGTCSAWNAHSGWPRRSSLHSPDARYGHERDTSNSSGLSRQPHWWLAHLSLLKVLSLAALHPVNLPLAPPLQTQAPQYLIPTKLLQHLHPQNEGPPRHCQLPLDGTGYLQDSHPHCRPNPRPRHHQALQGIPPWYIWSGSLCAMALQCGFQLAVPLHPHHPQPCLEMVTCACAVCERLVLLVGSPGTCPLTYKGRSSPLGGLPICCLWRCEAGAHWHIVCWRSF